MMSDLFKHRHAKLGCMVLRLFPRVMQTVLKYYFTTQGLRKKYLQTDFRFVFTQNESVLMNMLPNMDEFTIEICYKILRFEKMLDEPKCKWGNSPHDTEIGIADDIQRLIQATNSIIGKKSEEVTEHFAEKLLEEIKLMVTRIDSFLEQDTLGSMYNNLCRSETDCISILQDLTSVKVIEESLTNTESEKRERYSRLSIPIIETFPNILRNVIGQIIPVIKLYHMCALDIKKFYPEQQANIQELQNSNTYNSLDVTLIYQLLRQFKLIQPPQKGWGSIPDKVDIQLGDDVERIRYYRNKLAHRRDTKVDKKEFNEYFDEFCEIGYRMDQKSLQPTNYEQEISGYRTCVMDTAMQAKYENALKEIENITLRYEKRPIRVYWGISFERSLMDLRSLLKDAKLEGREKVRVQIVFHNEADIESNAEVLNSLKEEINEGLRGIELIDATKGSIVLHVDILMEMLETDEQLLTTLAFFFKKIMERITIFPTETIDFTLFPVEDNLTEHTQWNKPKTIGKQVYLDFDIEAQLLENDDVMIEQLTKISDVFLKHSNGSGTNQNITATFLPINLENISTNEQNVAHAETPMENSTITEAFAGAQTPVKYNLPVSIPLRQRFNINKPRNENLGIHSCIKIGNKLVFTDFRNTRLIICNSNGSDIHHISLSPQAFIYITEINNYTVAVSCGITKAILIINISTGSVTRTINTRGFCDGISCHDNNLYVVIDRRFIHEMDLTGKFKRSIPLSSDICVGVTVTKDGLVYINSRSIYGCSLDGKIIWQFESDQFQDLRCVTTDDEGNVYVTDCDTNTVLVVSKDGARYREILTEKYGLHLPRGIYFDKKENILLVCNYGDGDVFLFDVKQKETLIN